MKMAMEFTGEEAVLAEADGQGHFKRAMGLLDSTAVVVGSMIGSGIFIVSADIARQMGSPFWLIMCWLFAGVLTIMGALCYGELAAMFPKAGGQYVFLRQAYGPLAAFLYGWTLFAVIQCGTIAAVAVAFAKFTGVFIPCISNTNVIVQIANWKFTTAQALGVLVIALHTYINCRGIHTAKMIQTVFTVTKVGALFGLIALGLLAFNNYHGLEANLANFWQAVDTDGKPLTGFHFLGVMAVAMVGSLFSCDAWNNITFASEEVKEPEKTLPKAMALGTLLVTLIYVLTNVVYLLLLPLHGDKNGIDVISRGIQFALEDRVGTAAASVIFGSPAVMIMAGAIMISTFGCLNGLILAGSRAYYAMARDGLFFKKVAELSPKSNVPVFGLLLQGIWAAILTTSGTYGNLLDYVVFAALAFYVLTVAAVMVLRAKDASRNRPYRTPLYPVLPVLYIVFAVSIMTGQICLSPQYTGLGLLLILSGLPAYWFWHGRGKKSA